MRNKKTLIGIISVLILPILACAQGINFQEPKDWKTLLQMAKAENKIIFLDCYATWCAPCKKMDNEVYPLPSVGALTNSNFISVKIQLDSTGYDSDFVKSWRNTAGALKKEYGLVSMPSYVFINADGKGLHKATGFKKENEFLELLAEAKNPDKQIYTLLRNFKNDYSMAPKIIAQAKAVGEVELSKKVARTYINDYLVNQPKTQCLTRDNLKFIGNYLTWKDQKAIQLLVQNRDDIDKLMEQAGFSNSIIQESLRVKYVKEAMAKKQMPNWMLMENELRKSYKTYGIPLEKSTVGFLWIKVAYYDAKKMNDDYVRSMFELWEKEPPQSSIFVDVGINNLCYYSVFQKTSDRKLLEKALKWMEILLKRSPVDESSPNFTRMNFHDTYAGLLYKYGRTAEAIAMQEKIIQWSQKLSDELKKIKAKDISDFEQNLEKMKKGEPIWPVKATVRVKS